MNGVHDMGGMHGMGPVEHEENEPVFHEPWEGRSFAITRALSALGKWNIDAGRYAIEVIPPADYLRMSYYEKWLVRNIRLLVERGVLTREEIASGKPAPESGQAMPAVTAADVPAMAAQRGPFTRPDATREARFSVGQQVRARNIHPEGHTRLPRYARGKRGVIFRHHGIFVFPDSNAHFLGEDPQHLYAVRFPARELWGEAASPRDSIFIDMWDSYLEHA